MPQEKSTRIPAPVYAAAGVGDLAYQQLRKLPTVVGELSGKAIAGTYELRDKALATRGELREKAATTSTDLREKALTGTAELRERALATWRVASSTATGLREKATTVDLDADRLRELAKRNTAAFVASAQAAQERAAAIYGSLVAHGERVVGTGIVEAADTVNADMETTEAPGAVTATPADVAEAVAETPAEKKPVPARKATKSTRRPAQK